MTQESLTIASGAANTEARDLPQERAKVQKNRSQLNFAPRSMERLHAVGDGGEQPARFDGGRQLALLIEHGADCRSLCLSEHVGSMGTHITKQDRRTPCSDG